LGPNKTEKNLTIHKRIDDIYIFAFLTLNIDAVIEVMKLKGLDTEVLEKAANMLKAIAHPMRIAILNHLEDGKRLSVTEIHHLLNIEQSTASHHLGILKDKGVLGSVRDGKNTLYFLKHDSLRNIVECVSRCSIAQ
jgi:DNA-binding transcriptional ArsR family regulator